MGFKVKQATPGWPLQLAMSRGKNSDLGQGGWKILGHLFNHQQSVSLARTVYLGTVEGRDPGLGQLHPTWETARGQPGEQ